MSMAALRLRRYGCVARLSHDIVDDWSSPPWLVTAVCSGLTIAIISPALTSDDLQYYLRQTVLVPGWQMDPVFCKQLYISETCICGKVDILHLVVFHEWG